MRTTEGRVKEKLRKLLKGYPGLYQYWPVPSGFGRTTVDVLGCYRGRFFAVELKAEGKKPTLKQHLELVSVEQAMGKSFVIAGVESPVFDSLKDWLDNIESTIPNAAHLLPDPVQRQTI